MSYASLMEIILIEDKVSKKPNPASPVSNDGRGLKQIRMVRDAIGAALRPSAMTGVD